MVLKLGKLEYHVTQYLSILGSSTFYKIIIKKNIYTLLESSKLEYCVIFFFLFFCFLFRDNQKINIKIKISVEGHLWKAQWKEKSNDKGHRKLTMNS